MQARDNMAARVKHADAPERFMDTEVDLDEAVRQLQAVASAPELYPDFVRLGAVPGVLALLGHENGDLAASVAELLRELTDADAVEDSARRLQRLFLCMLWGARSCSVFPVSNGLFGWKRCCLTMHNESHCAWSSVAGCESPCLRHASSKHDTSMIAQEEEARELVAAMVEANGLESLVLRLGNLDEGVVEEDAAVLNALSTLENMIELQPSVPAPAQHACASAVIC